MRILFFSNHVSNEKHQASGWVATLVTELKQCKGITVGVAHLSTHFVEKELKENVSYYCIPLAQKGIKAKIESVVLYKSNESEKRLWAYYIDKCKTIVNDFKPDIIQVFGSELYCGLIAGEVNTPVVLHIQGFKNACIPSYFPPGVSKWDYIWKDKKLSSSYRRFMGLIWWRRNSFTENEILNRTKYFIGRTSWDHNYISLFNQHAHYFHGEEMMRPVFYEPSHRTLPEKLTIITVISSPLYKGFDNILRTANVLSNVLNVDFSWKVFGNIDSKFAEKCTKLKCRDLNIQLMGSASAETIKKELEVCTLYYHSSYIENSCNSVIEAQMTGCPVIANYVGGLTTIIDNGKNGLLVPANDPFQTAYNIFSLFKDPQKNLTIGRHAREMALREHDRVSIVCGLIDIYKKILDIEKK